MLLLPPPTEKAYLLLLFFLGGLNPSAPLLLPLFYKFSQANYSGEPFQFALHLEDDTTVVISQQ